ncbi:MAG: ATPase, partial [Sedimentitalea sp.]
GDDAHTQDLIDRFDRAPKPMSYQGAFLDQVWESYLSDNNILEGDVDPDHFIRATYAQALAHRQPRYQAMSKWGVTVTADDMARVRSASDFDTLIAAKLDATQA